MTKECICLTGQDLISLFYLLLLGFTNNTKVYNNILLRRESHLKRAIWFVERLPARRGHTMQRRLHERRNRRGRSSQCQTRRAERKTAQSTAKPCKARQKQQQSGAGQRSMVQDRTILNVWRQKRANALSLGPSLLPNIFHRPILNWKIKSYYYYYHY